MRHTELDLLILELDDWENIFRFPDMSELVLTYDEPFFLEKKDPYYPASSRATEFVRYLLVATLVSLSMFALLVYYQTITAVCTLNRYNRYAPA